MRGHGSWRVAKLKLLDTYSINERLSSDGDPNSDMLPKQEIGQNPAVRLSVLTAGTNELTIIFKIDKGPDSFLSSAQGTICKANSPGSLGFSDYFFEPYQRFSIVLLK